MIRTRSRYAIQLETLDWRGADQAQLQVKEGIDAVIVDSVLAIRKGLTGPDAVPPVQ